MPLTSLPTDDLNDKFIYLFIINKLNKQIRPHGCIISQFPWSLNLLQLGPLCRAAADSAPVWTLNWERSTPCVAHVLDRMCFLVVTVLRSLLSRKLSARDHS